MIVVSDERWKIRVEFAATLRVLGRAGFEMGSAGHLTVADPEQEGLFWANPFGVPFADTVAEDIVLVDMSGKVVFGNHDCRGAQTQTPVYAVRPDIRAMVHVHGLSTMAWSNLGRPFRALTTESAEIVGLQAVNAESGTPYAEGFLDPSVKILLNRFHGCVSAGATIAEAAFYTMAVERAAKTEFMLAHADGVQIVPDEVITHWAITPELAEGDFRQEIEREIRISSLLGR